MMYRILGLITLFICSFSVSAQWQVKEMKKIDKEVRKQQKCKCLSKSKTIGTAKVNYYFTSKKHTMIKIVERKYVDGGTVFKQFFFDKKTGGLISVNMGTTIFYYQSTGYFSVLSSNNFTPEEAKERADELLNLARKYIKALK